MTTTPTTTAQSDTTTVSDGARSPLAAQADKTRALLERRPDLRTMRQAGIVLTERVWSV